jgi:hypothetical protein
MLIGPSMNRWQIAGPPLSPNLRKFRGTLGAFTIPIGQVLQPVDIDDDDRLGIRRLNDVLFSQSGERPADSFNSQPEEIGDIVSADLKLDPVCMTATS